MPEVDIPLVWLVPIIVAFIAAVGGVLVAIIVAFIAAVGGVLVAIVNRRPNQQATLLEAMAKNREADSKENARLDAKVDSLYIKLGIERDYSMSWEDWHAAGMPDPPGRPRRNLDPNSN